ncbi:uncharacterized protein EI97DRAFT_429040 [Westerdykella ornata]|uniref:J domain-containing protein n=1 Tax=Westerdykella ornata TaxID=318751 RepID=A0A6A6K0T7_WESOR|nr:uncharacterized protein EI97DRAFT_429040 [Westerdykella ornata]KAF2280949.1 hypothetical protein EI97DRAFT_429040 [Westerdykella ornata]
MKFHAFISLALCLFVAAVAGWTKEDHEIFRLRDEVIAHNGPNVTFYSLLGVRPFASHDEITKAYRKKSKDVHPDKARQKFVANYAKTHGKKQKGAKPGVKVAKHPSEKEIKAHIKKVTEDYQRMTVIAEILKGPSRERYDHFLRNGFPKWRGTGYYYARFRPGLGSVLLGLLVVMGGGFHYFALVIGWKRRREFVERYIRHARRTAWGDDTGIQGIPGVDSAPPAYNPPPAEDAPEEMMPMNRRQKRMMDRENRKEKKTQAARTARRSGISTPVEAEPTSGPQGAKKRIVAENGKMLVVDSVGNVFLEEETEDGMKQEFLLDPDEEPKPTIYDTLLFKLPKFVFNQSIGRLLGNQRAVEEPLLEPSSSLPEDDAAIQSATAPNANGEARKRRAKAKAAGN